MKLGVLVFKINLNAFKFSQHSTSQREINVKVSLFMLVPVSKLIGRKWRELRSSRCFCLQIIPCCLSLAFPLFVSVLSFIASIEEAVALRSIVLRYTSTCPLKTNSGRGKERRILIGPW